MNIKFKKEKTLCLTGHRPKGLPWGYNEESNSCKAFKKVCKKVFINAIEKEDITYFLTGMAEGFDMIAIEILLELRCEYEHIKIIAIIPCLNLEIRWKQSQQQRYKNLLNKCDEIFILSKNYTRTCMNDRNKYMIENSAFCIACYNGSAGGTRNTIKLAKEKGIKIKIIKP